MSCRQGCPGNSSCHGFCAGIAAARCVWRVAAGCKGQLHEPAGHPCLLLLLLYVDCTLQQRVGGHNQGATWDAAGGGDCRYVDQCVADLWCRFTGSLVAASTTGHNRRDQPQPSNMFLIAMPPALAPRVPWSSQPPRSFNCNARALPLRSRARCLPPPRSFAPAGPL